MNTSLNSQTGRRRTESSILTGRSLPLLVLGSVLMLVSPFLSWSYNRSIMGNIGIYGYPGGVQVYFLGLVIMAGLLLLHLRGPLRRFDTALDVPRGLRAVGLWSVIFMLVTILSIAILAPGLVNVDPGAWVGLAGSVMLLAGARMMPSRRPASLLHVKAPAAVEIGLIVALVAAALFAAAYALAIQDAATLVLFLIAVGGVFVALSQVGLSGLVAVIVARHRTVLMLAAFVAAFTFPFTQNGSDANMSIATQVIVFAAAAMGLNIVVGQAGLLDLGYIAFLGAGAYVAAMMSHSTFATIGWHPPFPVVVLIGATVSAILGLIIGSPTLRVSGDYLAIVTLAFGEIFRLAMINLNGTNGPDLTHGSNGIPAIPDLNLFGFDFGARHDILGFTIPRFANYYFLLLVVIGFIILVFTRLADSRIGRGWIAIREDEKAAEAMGVNVFGLKLFAFAGGAFLAGLAGTVKAHADGQAAPDQYQFLESAFLLAAVVLGGMGTVGGVLLGALILKLLPEKLRFFSEYRLMLFGALLIVMMRFRPEGMIASSRRKLEFHSEDEKLAEKIEDLHIEKVS